jgi:hypothetical protein
MKKLRQDSQFLGQWGTPMGKSQEEVNGEDGRERERIRRGYTEDTMF